MDSRELQNKALSFIKLHGPVLPVQVAKNIGKEILFASAIISSLVAGKQVKITNVKIGGSPLYYVSGQEYKLQGLNSYLKQPEREVYELLKKNVILRDSELTPVQRVALRETRDFAVQIDVNFGDKREIFWKWYLISDSEAQSKISNILKTQIIPLETEIRREIKESKRAEIRKELYKKIEKAVKKPIEETKPEINQEIKPKIEVKEEKEIKNETKETFEYFINDFIKKNQIEILNYEIKRKNRELNMVIKLPTQIGNLKFLLIAKNKKTITNADLSLAYQEGQQKKLQVLFLTTGKPTKKAIDYAEKNLKDQLILKQI